MAVVIYARDSTITAEDKSAVEADRAAFASLSSNHQVDPAISSKDGRALLLSLPIAGDGPRSQAAVDRI